MNLILFDDNRRNHLLPFTYTRPIADLRIGILTIREKWEKLSDDKASFLTQDYLQTKFPTHKETSNLLIAGSILPDKDLLQAIRNLKEGQMLVSGDAPIAAHDDSGSLSVHPSDYQIVTYSAKFHQIKNTWDIFSLNGIALEWDFNLITSGRKSAAIPEGNTVIGDRIFLEEGAKVSCSILNTSTGPIYIGKNAEVWEGSIIRGAFALCEEASVKLGAKIYGPTTVGPHSRVGGEISNCVIQGYSNKGHDGFLGNSVLGEWCNLGADTNNSNLKNNYASVKLWDYADQQMVNTGLQFCGLMMGDHSKCGINTMFNTGTVVGVSANIYGAGFPPNFIPSFSWGGAGSMTEYRFDQAAETATRMMERRHVDFDATEREILQHVFDSTAGERSI
jgi:UDP-N-acetylglucosamine diphosphorylase/glucosamine-1-phosphate N-acetyltransferase